MYSFLNLEPAHFSMSSSNCCFLTYIQISQEADKVVWYSHLLKNFPQFVVIHIVKGFSIVNEAELDVFLEFSCFFCDPVDVGNSISGSSALPKSCLNIWTFLIHVLLKPCLVNFEHHFASMWDIPINVLKLKKICQNVHTDDVCSSFVNLALLCIFQTLYKDHKLFDSMSFVFVLGAG